MTKIKTSALASAALAATLCLGLACSKGSSDTGRVLANVGGEKITEGEFREIAALIVPKDQLDSFLNAQDPRSQAQRTQVLKTLVQVRATIQYAKAHGLDQDPKVQLQLDASRAQAYQYALVERSVSEPTEAQLKAQYDTMAAASKAAGQDKGFPSFEEVSKNPQERSILVQRCQQSLMAEAQQRLQAEIKGAVPVTYAEGYQGAE